MQSPAARQGKAQKNEMGRRTAGRMSPGCFTVARNLIGNAYRSRDRQLALQEKLRAEAVLGCWPRIRKRGCARCLNGLREKDRDILHMAYWDGLGTGEIASVLQCSESAAKVRLLRARAAFRKLMPAGAETITQRIGA